jgi:hypothetical protein
MIIKFIEIHTRTASAIAFMFHTTSDLEVFYILLFSPNKTKQCTSILLYKLSKVDVGMGEEEDNDEENRYK